MSFNGLPTFYFCRDVKLPGRSRNAPAVFPFGTEYLEMYDALSREDNEVREDEIFFCFLIVRKCF